MPETPNKPQSRKISLGFIFTIILVVGLIGIFVWRIFGTRDS